MSDPASNVSRGVFGKTSIGSLSRFASSAGGRSLVYMIAWSLCFKPGLLIPLCWYVDIALEISISDEPSFKFQVVVELLTNINNDHCPLLPQQSV